MIDQLTRNKRAEFFRRRDFVEHITEQQRTNHLNVLGIIRGVPKGLHRIGRFPMDERNIALRKALFISRRSARIADASVDANISVNAFEKMDPVEKHLRWNGFYEGAMDRFKLKPEIRDDPGLMRQMIFLQKFFALPPKLYEQRCKHSTIIKKVLNRLTENHIDPKENFLLELERLVKRAKEGTRNIRIFAMDVCVASSIYADMKKREGLDWSEAYQAGMEIAYSRIKDFHELVDAIAAL